MNEVKYILAQPDYIEGVGFIYPIRLKDYDTFQKCSKLLYVSKQHFVENDVPLFALIFYCAEHLGYTVHDLIIDFETLFSLTLRETVVFNGNKQNVISFCNEERDKNINVQNYDEVRKIIMKQNLIFEQKIFKDPLVQEWAEKVMRNRRKNTINITIEDMITTVSAYKGCSYKDLQDYTLYQLYADFYRIRKIIKYESDIILATVSTEKRVIDDFAEEIDLFKNPYEDLFVSDRKLEKLNQIFQDK